MSWYDGLEAYFRKFSDKLSEDGPHVEVALECFPVMRHGLYYGNTCSGVKIKVNEKGKITWNPAYESKTIYYEYTGDVNELKYKVLSHLRSLYTRFGVPTDELDEEISELSKILSKD